MRPHGSGGAVVPLPEYSGMWQRAWVERERQRPESQMHQGGRIEDITEQAGGDGPAGKVRNLILEEVSPRWETPLVGALTLGTSGIQLHAGEVRAYVAQGCTSGEVEAWVEAKWTADDMEDTITVAGARDRRRKRQAREVSYPRAGGGAGESSGGSLWVSFDADEEVIMRESPPMAESPGTLDYSPGPQEQEEDSESEEEVQKKTRRASRKAGTQRARRVPIKLRSEAQPEKMVDKILDQPIDHITMRELLGLSPDLLAEIWGVRRFLPFNKAAILATQATDMVAEGMAVAAGITEDKGKGKARLEAHTYGLPRGRRPAGGLRVLYACASPTVMGKIEGRLRVKMLIESGRGMNVSSQELW